MFTSRTCVRARARRSTCMQDGSRGARARAKLLYIWHYVSDSIPTKLFWGLTFSSAGGLSEEKYQSQFGNIFPVALFCPPLPFVPPSQVLSCHQFLEGISKVKFSTPLSLKYLRLLGPRLLRWLSKQRMWASPKLWLAHWDWGSRTFSGQAAECLVSGTFQGTQNH